MLLRYRIRSRRRITASIICVAFILLHAPGLHVEGISASQGDSAPLPKAPVFATGENPFVNTCDAKAIGFAGPSGERPKILLRNMPPGAIAECRSGPEAKVQGLKFTPCDAKDGTKPFHEPPLTMEGTYRTEVRYVLGRNRGAVSRLSYYAHHSLDRVPCCRLPVPDAAWFEAARPLIGSGKSFNNSTQLSNPFIQIATGSGPNPSTKRIMSLRRTFIMSADMKLLLIRRTMASRRTLEKTGQSSCIGLSISVPEYGPANSPWIVCPERRETRFRMGLVSPKCPNVYCTVTTCEEVGQKCIQVTHTFYRGPGQKPWIVKQPKRCPPISVVKYHEVMCDAYALNADGIGVCLKNDGGKIRAVEVIGKGKSGSGLAVLGQQEGVKGSNAHYVFSAKTRKAGVRNVLYLSD